MIAKQIPEHIQEYEYFVASKLDAYGNAEKTFNTLMDFLCSKCLRRQAVPMPENTDAISAFNSVLSCVQYVALPKLVESRAKDGTPTKQMAWVREPQRPSIHDVEKAARLTDTSDANDCTARTLIMMNAYFDALSERRE